MLNKTQKKTSSEKYKITINNVKNLPQTTGVYVFRGKSDFPLYIGKSVNIRSRVMSHLRNPNEKKMISQVLQIDFIETAGEIGALLLESQMIKEYSPLFNMRLRRLRYLCTISTKKTANGISPKILDSKSVSFGFTPDLYGLFPSRHAANAKLRKLYWSSFRWFDYRRPSHGDPIALQLCFGDLRAQTACLKNIRLFNPATVLL